MMIIFRDFRHGVRIILYFCSEIWCPMGGKPLRVKREPGEIPGQTVLLCAS